MDVCNLPRGGGKTTYLVYRSHVTRIQILCINKNNVQVVQDMAKRLNLAIPEPISVFEYMGGYVNTKAKTKPNRLLVDEALYILAQILGTEVDTVSLTEYEKRY